MVPMKLRRVLDELVAEGSLNDGQRAQILDRISSRASRSPAALIITLLASFGAVLVAAGLLYLVAFNWSQFPPLLQQSVAIGSWLAVHVAAAICTHAPGRYPRVGSALEFLGMLLFIGMVGLMAQIYKIESDQPWALLAWWACYTPLLLWRGTLPLQLLWTGVFTLWAMWHSHDWLRLANKGIYSEGGVFYIVTALGALFASLAVLSRTTSRASFASLWTPLGSLGGFFGIYILSFEDAPWAEGADWHKLLPTIAASALALIALGIAWWRGAQRGALLGPALLILAAVLWPPVIWQTGKWAPLLGNLLCLASILFVAWRGVRTARAADVNLSLALFSLLVVTRYIEYLWDKLEGAYAFLATGALLLALGWFMERRRRDLLRRIA